MPTVPQDADDEMREFAAAVYGRPVPVPEDTTRDEMREFATAVFSGHGRPGDVDEPDEDTRPGNHVPREGSNPRPGRDDPLRELVRELFDRPV